MWLLRSVVHYNSKTCQILGLCVPFTFSVVVGTVTNLVFFIIFMATLGSNVTVAYVTMNALVNVSSSLTGSYIEAVSSLGSMTYGSKNYNLVGQYTHAYYAGQAPNDLLLGLHHAEDPGADAVWQPYLGAGGYLATCGWWWRGTSSQVSTRLI